VPKTYFSGIFLSLLLPLLLVSPGAIAQEAALVSVDPVIRHQFTRTVPILGHLVARRSGTVATRINGAIDEVLVDLGDAVSLGQVLARIDSQILELRQRHAQSQLAESQTRLKTANAQLELASQEVKRLEGLTSSATVSQAAYDDARQQQNIAVARVNEAEAGINSSRTSLEIAQLELSYVDILAPFDGTITGKLTEVGNYLQPGEPVFQLISNNDLELEADIPGVLIGGLSRDVEIEVELENGSRHSATLRAIIPEENPRTRTRRVRFNTQLGSDAGMLASEQSATLHLPASDAREIISVHKDGVIRRGSGNIVFVVVDNAAEMKTIQTGAAMGNRIEVLDGIAEGELVVVRGNERLQPGQAVLLPQ
jgi:RND family efflux transporter MFP subunit